MRSLITALGLGVVMTSTARAQSSWVGSIQGGYSVSTAIDASFSMC